MEGPVNETLRDLLKSGLKLQKEVEESSIDPDVLQERISHGIRNLEEATRLVSSIDLFSRNENVSEINTEHLPYLLLPALLGLFNSRLSDPDNRIEHVRVAVVYYTDFLIRANEYEIVDCKIPSPDVDEEEKEIPSRPQDLRALTVTREEKIRRYKEKKSIEEDLNLINDEHLRDEEVARSYNLKLIKRFVFLALEEVDSLIEELRIQKHIQALRRGDIKPAPAPPNKAKSQSVIIMPRHEARKKVFGLGYSSIPVMTVEEFYEKRVREGVFPGPGEASKAQKSLMERAEDEDRTQAEKEEEEREKEEKIERDDEETLARARYMDEYRDTHKRGEGNRHNKG